MRSDIGTSGKGKLTVSAQIEYSSSSGMLPPTYGRITSNTISSFDRPLSLSTKPFGNRGIDAGKYRPSSSGWPRRTASRKVTSGDRRFVLKYCIDWRDGEYLRSRTHNDNTFRIDIGNMQEIRVHAPATVANVVCGFDCLGFALREPFDEMIVRRTDEPGIRMINRDNYKLPTEPERNVAGVTAAAMLEKAKADFGIEIEITKHIMPGSGIGSSAASSAGTVVAINRLLNDRFSRFELVDLAMEGEKLASGSRHADNVAPCIFGGFTLV